MKHLIVLVALLISFGATADEFVVDTKNTNAQKVDAIPGFGQLDIIGESSSSYGSGGAATIEGTILTSWCGMANITVSLDSMNQAKTMLADINAAKQIPGTVTNVESFIVSVENNVVSCSVETVQAFEFPFKGEVIVGSGTPFTTKSVKADGCSALYKEFQK